MNLKSKFVRVDKTTYRSILDLEPTIPKIPKNVFLGLGPKISEFPTIYVVFTNKNVPDFVLVEYQSLLFDDYFMFI